MDIEAGTPEQPEFQAPASRRRRRKLILAAAVLPIAGVALFAATLVHGSDQPRLISETSSIRVVAPVSLGPDGATNAMNTSDPAPGECDGGDLSY